MEMGMWQWLIAGIALILVEVFAPGFIFIWFGLGALVTGGALAFWPELGWPAQLGVFLSSALFCTILWFTLGRRWMPARPDENRLNRRGEQHIGHTFHLSEAISNGRGRIEIGDGSWPVSGADMAKGNLVRVTALDGAIFTVEAVSD